MMLLKTAEMRPEFHKRKVYISQIEFRILLRRKEDCKLKLSPLLFIVSKDFYNTPQFKQMRVKNRWNLL